MSLAQGPPVHVFKTKIWNQGQVNESGKKNTGVESVTPLELFNFQSPEVVSRYCDTQLQVTENLCYLWNLTPNIYQCFRIEGIFSCKQLVIRGYTGANKNNRMSTAVCMSGLRVDYQPLCCFTKKLSYHFLRAKGSYLSLIRVADRIF